MKSIIPRCICRREEEEIIMANFCTKCGRPLPEDGICPCTLQQPVNPEAPQAQAEPQYRIPQQPQYQAPQYQAPQYQTAAPVQAPPAPKEPSAFGKAITDLPKKFLRFIKNPIATIQASVEKKDLMGGIVGMAVSVIACFLATLVYALRWGFGFAAWAWIVVGMFAPVVACGFTLLGYFVMSKRGLGIQRTTELIDRECYIPDIAQARYEDHYPDKGPGLKIGKDHRLARYLEAAIKGGNRSPEAALGEIKAKGLVFDTEISVRTLYRYIDLGLFLGITNKDLPHKAAKKRGYRRVRAARAPKGLSIEQRPEEINSRETFGHWEMDTVQGIQKSRPRLLVLTERLSRHEIMIPIKTNTTESVVKALNTLERKYGALFYKVFRSITVDNGPEFADCAGMERACRRKGARTTVYYCHPYSSWERGSNERQNGMIRRKHPKGTDFTTIPASTLKKTEEWINNYPRKIFNFHTAAEVFEACMNSL